MLCLQLPYNQNPLIAMVPMVAVAFVAFVVLMEEVINVAVVMMFEDKMAIQQLVERVLCYNYNYMRH